MAPTTPEVDVPVKRGRGRPPNPNKKPAAPRVPTGRPRGRPRKEDSAKVTKPAVKAVGIRAGAGRPGRPSAATKAAEAAAAAEAAPATAVAAPVSASGPGRRGRPRKSDVATAPTPKKGATPAKSAPGRRGRPRKSDVEQPEEEAEEEEDKEDDVKEGSPNKDEQNKVKTGVDPESGSDSDDSLSE